MPMPCSPEITPPRLRASAMMRTTAACAACSIGVVVAVDRDVGVHVAVAGMHVQGDPDAAAQDFLVDAAAFVEQRHEGSAGKQLLQRLEHLRLPRRAQPGILQQREEARAVVVGLRRVQPASQPDHSARTSASSASACCTRSSSSSALGISPASSPLPSGSALRAKKCSSASSSSSLLRRLSSMLMRSMPSVYSPMRSSGMTTSSLILKALVCLAIAAVRLRSSQNFLRASALTATKPSPWRELAMRTTSLVARATASSSSPTMSPTSTIFGRPLPLLQDAARLLLVA